MDDTTTNNNVDASSHTLCDLPDIVLLKILKYLDLQELLTHVCKTNKRLNDIVYGHSVLWRRFLFDIPVEFEKHHLQSVMKHAVGFQQFLIPFATIKCTTPELDYILTASLPKARRLYWIDLSQCRLSTLCFLQGMPQLKILNLSECQNLIDDDFEVISSLTTLDKLYVSFTRITPDKIVQICGSLTLTVLDTSGIPFSLVHCARVLRPDLKYFTVSLEREEEEAFFHGLVRRYRGLSVHICRRQ